MPPPEGGTRPGVTSNHAGAAPAVLASPLPVGFLALAVASFAMAGLQLGWVPVAQGHATALCVLVFTVPLQLLASIVAFGRGELAPATGMAVLAGTWAGVALTVFRGPPGSTSAGLGLFLCATGAAMLVAAGAALTEPLASLVMVCAAARFWTTAGYELTGATSWQDVAGWVGLAVAAVGFVVALLLAVRESGLGERG